MGKSQQIGTTTQVTTVQTSEMARYTLQQLVLYFLKLGTFGFGGPVALGGYMHRDLIEQRNAVM
jgi:chromate transporter